MPDRKSKKIEEREVEPTISLRRSPRLHRQNPTGAQSPRTPKPAETKRCRTVSFSTPISKIKKTGLRVSENGRGKDTESTSKDSRIGLRRSVRLERRANFSCPDLRKQCAKEKRQARSSIGGCNSVKASEKSGVRGENVGKRKEVVLPRKEEAIEKRVTRSSVGRIQVSYSSVEDSGESVVVVSKERKRKVGAQRTERDAGKTEKRISRSDVSNTRRRKAVMSNEVVPKRGEELCEKITSKKDVEACGIMERDGDQHCTRKAQIGEKRKRDGVEELCETAQGWSKEQEFSLQRAYFAAKPTPQFWKKVARMVMFRSCLSISLIWPSAFPLSFVRDNNFLAVFGPFVVFLTSLIQSVDYFFSWLD